MAALALALFLLPLAAMLLPPSLFPPRKPDAMHLVALDVGQGSATLIHYPSGRAVLIDGGGAATATPAVGERVIAPFLWSHGIATLDAMVITHADADHYNGLGFVLDHFPTTTLWVRDLHGHDEEYREVLQRAKRRGVMLTVPEVGETLAGLGPGESLRCLASPAAGLADGVASAGRESNNGLVVKACHRNGCALIPGDIDRAGERRLLASGVDLAANVLLSPHHGSKTSNSKEFLSTVAPQAMFVSTGRGNRGYFPHPGLDDDCLGLGIALFTTARHGTLTAKFTPSGAELTGYGRHAANPFLPCRPLPLAGGPLRVDSTPR
jgi:competence protein ComEC